MSSIEHISLGSQNNQVITFTLGDETYGVEVTKVREILTYPKVTELPNASAWVKGVINLRGEVTPIIDLRMRFKTSEMPEYGERTIVLAARTADNRMVGMVVDSVQDMETIEWENMAPPPEMGTTVGSENLRGLIKTDERMIVILDIERVLDKKELENQGLA